MNLNTDHYARCIRDLEITKIPFTTCRGDAVGSPAFRCYIRAITRLSHGRPAGIAPTKNGKSINSTSLTAHDYGVGFADETLKLMMGFISDARALEAVLRERLGRGES